MSGLQAQHEARKTLPIVGAAPEEFEWYAIHTMARHEKRVVEHLREHRLCTFLPLYSELRQWSDRRVLTELPLFTCYAFVRMAQTVDQRLRVLRTPGVLGFVGSERVGTPIPHEQIEYLQAAIREKVPLAAHPYLNAGQRVRVRGGSLNGMEGILVRHAGGDSLVVSVELLRRSVSIRVAGYEVEAV